HRRKLIVHRKGATRSFGPDNTEIPDIYLQTGQPVIIPGSMGTESYVLVGTNGAMIESFGSSCHGAGRRMSRHQARKQMQGKELFEKLKNEGINILTDSVTDLSEEAPYAYKDVSEVVDVVDNAGIARKVAKLKPVIVIKG
ncbi:MAG: RtcB family protein, partial [Patescibacteria group bacterium]|nr:RtcB family protein [Patescibacteria group bacterium]